MASDTLDGTCLLERDRGVASEREPFVARPCSRIVLICAQDSCLYHRVLNMGALPVYVYQSKRTQEERRMRIFGSPWLWLPCILAISAQAVYAQPPSPAHKSPSKVGNVSVADVLKRLGAKLEHGSEVKQLDSYSRHFDRTDPNRDGKHTKEEYVDKGG